MVFEVLIGGVVSGCLVGLVALSLTAVLYATNVVVFATGEILMAGAMGYYVLVVLLGVPWFVAFPVALILPVGIAVLIERALVTPLLARKANVVMCVIATFAASTVIGQGTLLMVSPLGYSVPFVGGFDKVRIGPLAILPQQIVVITLAVLVTVGFWLLMNKTMLGRGYRATGMNPRMASLAGIDTRVVRTLAFVIMGVAAGAAGVLIAPWTGAQALMGFPYLLSGFIACILGGLGNPYGGMVAGIGMGVLSVLLTVVGLSWMREILMFSLVAVMLVVRPGGLFGQATPAS